VFSISTVLQQSMSSLAFALTGPAVAPSTVAAPAGIRSNGQWTSTLGQAATGMSGSACLAASATIAAVVGRAMSKANRKRPALRAFDPTKEVGAMEPLGYWEPLSFMKEGFKDPQGAYKSEETFRWYREAELKHGRISMVAVLGLFAGECYKWPGFDDVPGGLAALDTEKGGAGVGILFLIAGIFELDFWKQDASKEPGNFGDPVGWTRMDGNNGDFWVYDKDMRNKELAHCRLAMSGVITSFLLEYGGYDTSVQFTSQIGLPGWVKFGIPALAGLWAVAATSNQFYVADDSGRLLVAAAPAPASLPASPAAPVETTASSQVMEKVDGRYRFKE